MTVGNLKRVINNLNDNMPIMIYNKTDINEGDIIPEEVCKIVIDKAFTVDQATGEPAMKNMVLLQTI